MTDGNFEEIPGMSSFQARLSVAEEEAAGGVCSRRVLHLLHDIEASRNSEYAQTVTASRSSQEVNDAGMSLTVLGLAEVQGRLVLAAGQGERSAGIKSQTVFIVDRRTKTALPLWQLIEEPPGSSNCSRSIFLPALDDGDLDWSQVVTSADERAAMSLEESVRHEPITNAAILKLLSEVINDQAVKSSLVTLLQAIHAPELWKRCIEGTDPFTDGDYASVTELPDFLYKRIANIGDWLALSGARVDHRSAIDGEPDKQLRFTLDAQKIRNHIQVTAEFPKLGSNGHREQSLGSLLLHQHMSTEPIFYTETGQEVGASEANEVTEYANKAFEVPRVVQDPELIAGINKILVMFSRKEIDKSYIDYDIAELVKACRSRNEYEQSCLDLGEIDIRGLGDIDFLSRLPDGWYRAAVHADKNQQVANNSSLNTSGVSFYDSSVYGANFAFHRITALQCKTMNVNKAFYYMKMAKGCVASQAEWAFFGPGIYSGNLATACNRAFIDMKQPITTDYKNNLAEDCESAFMGGAVMEDNVVVGRHKRREVLRSRGKNDAGYYLRKNVDGNVVTRRKRGIIK